MYKKTIDICSFLGYTVIWERDGRGTMFGNEKHEFESSIAVAGILKGLPISSHTF
jgi:hypothetical protein